MGNMWEPPLLCLRGFHITLFCFTQSRHSVKVIAIPFYESTSKEIYIVFLDAFKNVSVGFPVVFFLYPKLEKEVHFIVRRGVPGPEDSVVGKHPRGKPP